VSKEAHGYIFIIVGEGEASLAFPYETGKAP